MSDVCVTSEAPALGAAAAVHLLGRCRQRWTTRWVRRQRPSPCGAAEPGCSSGLELVPRSSALLLPGLRRAGRRAESRLDACRSHHRLSPGRRRRSGAATQPAAALLNCPHPVPLSGLFYSGRVLSRTWSSYSCVDRFVFVWRAVHQLISGQLIDKVGRKFSWLVGPTAPHFSGALRLRVIFQVELKNPISVPWSRISVYYTLSSPPHGGCNRAFVSGFPRAHWACQEGKLSP